MSPTPVPLVFDPLFKAKPWGGRRLAELFGKPLPAGEQIGEAWELADLPGNEVAVRDAGGGGQTLRDVVQAWGAGLVGAVPLVDGRFPLLIKFLDAGDNLSVQVHPKPAADDPQGRRPGIKHEAWYILHAEPGAQLYIGLEDGVGPADLERVAGTPALVDLLRKWPGRTGDCYYLPSGTLHALGAGLVVAEVQTPSDITYRAYDWDRAGLDGRPRELHLAETLANTRFDVPATVVKQTPVEVAGVVAPGRQVAACDRFRMTIVTLPPGFTTAVPAGRMVIWMVLAGAGTLRRGAHTCGFHKGDTVLVPADCAGTELHVETATQWVEVTVGTDAG